MAYLAADRRSVGGAISLGYAPELIDAAHARTEWEMVPLFSKLQRLLPYLLDVNGAIGASPHRGYD